MHLSLLSQVHYFRQLQMDHPEVNAHPVRFARRLAEWRVLSAFSRPCVVPFTRYGVEFICPPEWRGMSKMAYTLRDAYEPEMPHLARWVSKDSVAVDVGAHYGAWTIALAALGASVHAIEPARHALEILHRNIELNNLRNVITYPVALGEAETELELFMHADASRASMGDFVGKTTGVEVVRVTTLDELIPDRVDFIKIDIEGFELPALKGASRILAARQAVVLFEVQPQAARRSGHEPFAAWQLLADHGYRFEQLSSDNSWRSVDRPEHARSPNVVAIPR